MFYSLDGIIILPKTILYLISIVQIPIGLIGGMVQSIRGCFEFDPEKRREKFETAKVLFISGIPFVGPCLAFNRSDKLGRKPETATVNI